jgi:hypothetical protein
MLLNQLLAHLMFLRQPFIITSHTMLLTIEHMADMDITEGVVGFIMTR